MKRPLLAIALALSAIPAPALAKNSSPDIATLAARLDRLEAENAKLKAEVVELTRAHQAEQAAPPETTAAAEAVAVATPMPAGDGSTKQQVIGVDADYSGKVLGHTELVNQRRIVQLQARQAGKLDNLLTVSGELIMIADAHWSNRANKFGYLMRHPTGNNQRTKASQEMTVNSTQLALTVAPTKGFTGYVEAVYDPEQSFGAGTLTALTRNQVQIRKAYVLVGDLDRSPFYASIGKMDVPFGLQDSVSPFTNSTNWHAFAPLAYGGELGYLKGGLSVRAMAIGGGAQFRGANTPVDGTAIPSKLNNFSLDASYRYNFGQGSSVMLGASYLHGSAYCQDYPIVHFGACNVRVPAWSAYGRAMIGKFELIGEFARTTKVWPGTKVPSPANPLSVYPAARVTSFTAGARYTLGNAQTNTKASLEFSKFIAGPQASPWHRQDQTVLGISHQFVPGVSLFGEGIRVSGFVPLNFASGGNFPDGSTWSERDATSKVLMAGVRLGF